MRPICWALMFGGGISVGIGIDRIVGQGDIPSIAWILFGYGLYVLAMSFVGTAAS